MKRLILLGFVLVFALASGCAQAPAPTSEPQAPAEVVTEEVPPEQIVLNVLGGEADLPERVETYSVIDKMFEDAHPGVKIDRQTILLDDLIATSKLRLSGSDAPDIVQLSQGYPALAPLVEAKLLVSLDDYKDKFDFHSRQPETLLAMQMFTDDGKTIGTGKLWGISATGGAVGVYYNKERLESFGLQKPKTFAEFEAALQKIKDEGEPAIILGNLDGWPALNDFDTVLSLFETTKNINDFVYSREAATFNTPEVLTAVETFKRWFDDGYFVDGANGIGYDEAAKRFANGETVFLIGGSWLTSGFLPTMGDNVGYFLMPRIKEGDPQTAFASGDLAWGIPVNSKHKDLAAEYIHFVTGPEAAKVWAEHGDIPASGVDTSSLDIAPVLHDTISAWQELIDLDGFNPFLDWATPTMWEVIIAAGQELIGNQISPQDFIDKVQSDYEAFQKTR